MIGLQNSTTSFMVVLGRVAGFINLFLIFAASVVFLYLGVTSVTGGDFPAMIEENPERKRLLKNVGPWLVPLALIMMYTVWRVGEMVAANRQLSGFLGLAAFLKALIL